MEPLEEFISGRIAEINKQAAPLKERLAELDAERDKLIRAANAAGIKIGNLLAAGVGGLPIFTPRAPRKASEATIKDAVLDVLYVEGRAMTALEILPLVNAKLGIEYPRTSLSPQLSRLKVDGKVVRDGSLWSLAPELKVIANE